MSHKTSVIPFPKHEVKAACDAQIPVMQHLSEKDIAAFVKNKINRRTWSQ
jgi:hypothetical protein